MTTTPTKADPLTAIPCPSWCTLAPGHPADSTDPDHGDLRGHGGPDFGKHLSSGADEYAAAPGQLAYVVQLNAEGVNITRPSELLDLATAAIAAAKWLEARR